MARHVPPIPRRRRAVSAVLAGAAALGAVALVPGAASAAPVPTAPTTTPVKADLSVAIESPTTTIEANGATGIGIVVTNDGPADADRVRTLVTLPPGLVAFDGFGPVVEQNANGTTYRFDEPTPLASGQTRTYALLVGSTRARPSSGFVTAGTRSTTLDPALRNNTARSPLRAAGGPPAF